MGPGEAECAGKDTVRAWCCDLIHGHGAACKRWEGGPISARRRKAVTVRGRDTGEFKE